jgi:hypothetical protein
MDTRCQRPLNIQQSHCNLYLCRNSIVAARQDKYFYHQERNPVRLAIRRHRDRQLYCNKVLDDTISRRQQQAPLVHKDIYLG